MSTVIEAKNISKKYVIYHEVQGAYSTIVDTISRSAKRFLRNLTKPFRKKSPPQRTSEIFWALNDLSFECNEGDRLGIIGKNGAGKSTLLKILSRIIDPSSGSFKIKGRVASLLEIGTGFHPELTGRENIFLNGAILGMRRSEILKKFDEIVAFAEINKFLDTPVKYYSSGMYARLGFAVAAHLDPDILIIDEVLAVGDAQFQEKCMNKMDAASRQGRTILFVSHNTHSMMTLCNKGILLERGAVKVQGPIDLCVNTYLAQTQTISFSWKGVAGGENLKLYSVVLEHNHEFFYRGDIATLKISCEIFSPLKDEIIGIEIKNNRQHSVLHSYFTHDVHLRNILNRVGKHTFMLEIDMGLLWEGEYTLHINYYDKKNSKILHDEISLRFPVYSHPNEISFLDGNFSNGIFYPRQWKTVSSEAMAWQKSY